MATNYPSDIIEFSSQFSSDAACFDYLSKIRWPNNFICPHCNQNGGWWLEKHYRYECKNCHNQTSPLSGTVMHRSHLPLRIWFWAAYLVSTHTPGMSAVQLQRQLGIKKIDTAWYLLHRLRKGMIRQNRDPLSGLIEADETHIGGPVKGKTGRGSAAADTKTLIIGAVEIVTYLKNNISEEKAGRLRLAIIKNAGQKEIKSFLNDNVTQGSQVKSDGWKGYSTSALAGYQHLKRSQQGDSSNAGKFAPHIHRAFGNLQTWINGIHHGVNPKYLQCYLDEFVFRYNRRETPMATFRSLLTIIANSSEPLGFKYLTKP